MSGMGICKKYYLLHNPTPQILRHWGVGLSICLISNEWDVIWHDRFASMFDIPFLYLFEWKVQGSFPHPVPYMKNADVAREEMDNECAYVVPYTAPSPPLFLPMCFMCYFYPNLWMLINMVMVHLLHLAPLLYEWGLKSYCHPPTCGRGL